MANARTLQPDQKISRYHVVGPLGAGGMGEVYLARDESLARNVALKILPPELVRSEERVRRFVLEARSASSLNHPNIVTIYDIGQDRIRAADGAEAAAGEAPVHFISMELVNGVTLGAKIHDEKADLRSLLGWLAQAAEGIAKAHAAGIVHRDLKPGNIMVTRDGFAKVLDFGLAKLAERRDSDADATAAPTVGGPATSEGVVLGTVGYMSPEQVQGRPVDHRSDVFSFGCILYEAATRQRPFTAESSVEVMHKILHDKPAPVEELNARAPTELRRLIRRCLAKDPEQRVQSMKDVAIELREIVDEFDALSASASSGSGTHAVAPSPARRGAWITATVAGLAVIAIVAAIAVRMLRPGAPRGFENPTITTVTSRGDVADVALSPDGRYLAYTSGPPAGRSIWVRQIATGSDVQVLPPQTVAPLGLTFSPDGNYLYYLHVDPERRGFQALYQMPTLGGAPVKRAYDVDTPVAFSPDGRQLCFARGVPATRSLAVVLLDLASGKERLLASSPWSGVATRARPSWSPRGDRIALVESGGGTFGLTHVWLYRVSDGRRDSLRTTLPPGISSLSWMPDGRSFALTCVDLAGVPRSQVFMVSVPGGLARRVTNDFDDYDQISSSAAGDLLAAVREERVANLWVFDLAGKAKQLTFATSPEQTVADLGVTPEGRLVYSAAGEHDVAAFATGIDGGAPTPLTTAPGYAIKVRGAKGAAVYQWVDLQNRFHVWRAGVDGGDAQPLTQGAGESLVDVSRDGSTVVYSRLERPNTLFAMPTGGGPERVLVSGVDRGIGLSPDGSGLLVMNADTVSGVYQFDVRIARVADGRLMPSLGLPARAADYQWTADGRSVSFIDSTDPSRNVWRKPVDGGPAVQVTHLAEGQVAFHRWSPDGRWLLLDVIRGANDDLWLASAAGGAPRRLTTFPTGHIFSASWLPNSQAIAIGYGTDSWDAALIRNTR